MGRVRTRANARRAAPRAGAVLRSAGESGLVVELGDAVDAEVNARVHALAAAVSSRLAHLASEVVPTYRSFLVLHDPLRVPRARLVREVERVLAEAPPDVARDAPGRLVEIPACYGGELGPDLDEIARRAGLSAEEVVALHSGTTYRVFMLGFTPGFPYLGALSPRIATPRLPAPRPRVAAGSIGIAGEQTGIYPVESPGGWRLVARTPLRLFDPAAPAPFLLAPGDRVRFAPIDRARYEEMARRASGADRAAGPEPAAGEPALSVTKPGLLTTVQDAGRPGFLAFGMPRAGAMDPEAYALANLLAGNAPGAAAIEMTLLGASFRFERAGYAAVAGADMAATLDGAPVRCGSGFPVRAGAVLAFGSAVDGCRTYLAVRGGVDVPPFLGSRSTYTRGRVGGLGGRALVAGDVLRVGAAPPGPDHPVVLPPGALRRGREVRLRVLLGPQDDLFAPEGLATFLGVAYTVSNRNDRMGYQLDGPAIRHRDGPDIVSDALLPGAVQVPGSGMPIVMMSDSQTVGGYAKIAAVVEADLPLLAQARRGDVVRFRRVGLAEAVRALGRARARLDAIAARLEGARRVRRR